MTIAKNMLLKREVMKTDDFVKVLWQTAIEVGFYHDRDALKFGDGSIAYIDHSTPGYIQWDPKDGKCIPDDTWMPAHQEYFTRR